MRRPVAGCLVLLALLAGCSGGGEDDDDVVEPTTTTARPGPGGLTAADITPLSVDLVDAGHGPRSVLAVDLAGTRATNARFLFDMAVEGVTSAHVEGTSALGVPGDIDDGTAMVHYGLGGLDVAFTAAGSQTVRVEDALAMNWQLAVGPDRGISSGTVRTITAGTLPGVENLAGSLDPRLTSLLLPFPADPVGTGARWSVEGPVPMFGASVDLTAQLELIERRGARFVVTAALSITTPDPGSAPDITMTGIGRLTGDLHQLGLHRGTVALSGTIALADPGASAIPLPMTMAVSIEER